MTGGTFTCDLCGGTFPKGWSDEEAAAEAEGLFSPAELEATSVVCDDCFRRIMPEMPRLRAELASAAEAEGVSFEEFLRLEARR